MSSGASKGLGQSLLKNSKTVQLIATPQQGQ